MVCNLVQPQSKETTSQTTSATKDVARAISKGKEYHITTCGFYAEYDVEIMNVLGGYICAPCAHGMEKCKQLVRKPTKSTEKENPVEVLVMGRVFHGNMKDVLCFLTFGLRSQSLLQPRETVGSRLLWQLGDGTKA